MTSTFERAFSELLGVLVELPFGLECEFEI